MTGGAMPRTKGAVAERAVAAWLRDNGWPDARRYLAGDGKQPGDIDAIPGVTLEVKAQRAHDIAGWLRQTETEAHGRFPLLVVKPPRITDVGDWWAVTRLHHLIGLLERDQ